MSSAPGRASKARRALATKFGIALAFSGVLQHNGGLSLYETQESRRDVMNQVLVDLQSKRIDQHKVNAHL